MSYPFSGYNIPDLEEIKIFDPIRKKEVDKLGDFMSEFWKVAPPLERTYTPTTDMSIFFMYAGNILVPPNSDFDRSDAHSIFNFWYAGNMIVPVHLKQTTIILNYSIN